jgi:glycosyltransferase involved in cell wall biosynthesis
VARRIAANAGVKGVVTTHHELFGSLNAYLRWATRRTDRHCDRLVYISRTVAKSYGTAETLDKNFRHQLIYNGIDIHRIESLVESDGEILPQQLISVGRLVPEKGHAAILQAMPQLVNEFPELRLVILGQGPLLANLLRLAQQLAIADRVEFRGRVPHDTAIREMSRSHCVVVPSRSEGFGLVLAEALLTGRPVVASDMEVFREVASQSGVTYFAENDVGDLSVALGAVLRDPRNLDIRPSKASARIKKYYSSEMMRKHYLKLYQSLLKRMARA